MSDRMNDEVQRVADDYIRRLRRSTRGTTRGEVDEIESEIRAHIEDALAARGEATVGALLDVLERLGPPEDYASDLGLYVMVDRGYREWSVPHMVRSTAFWSFSTVTGAVALLTFGLLFAGAAVVTLAGLLRVVPDEVFELVTGAQPLVGARADPGAAGLLVVVGLLSLGGELAVVRWFVGAYVRSARPDILGGGEADSGWVTRTSRRIVAAAGVGIVTALTAGLAAGIFRGGTKSNASPAAAYLSSPLALLSGLGTLVFLLAPVIGLLWTAAVERGWPQRLDNPPADM